MSNRPLDVSQPTENVLDPVFPSLSREGIGSRGSGLGISGRERRGGFPSSHDVFSVNSELEVDKGILFDEFSPLSGLDCTCVKLG